MSLIDAVKIYGEEAVRRAITEGTELEPCKCGRCSECLTGQGRR